MATKLLNFTIPAVGAAGTGFASAINAALQHIDDAATGISLAAQAGADPTGSSDSSAALTSAIQAAIATGASRPQVYIGPGRWLVNVDAVFSNLGAASQSGLQIIGAGWEASTLVLQTGGSARWFYKNTGSTLQFPFFAYLRFETDSATNGNGFWIDGGTGFDWGYHFFMCRFQGPWNDLFKFTGTVVTADNKLLCCRVKNVYGHVFHAENPNSVNHESIGTDYEEIYGDLVYIGAGGGGEFHFTHGSIIMGDGSPSPAPSAAYYMVRVDASNNTSPANGSVTFEKVKTEMWTAYPALVKGIGDGGQFVVRFVNSNLYTVPSGGTRDAVWIGNHRRVQFRDSIIPPEFTYRIDPVAGSAPADAFSGVVDFEGCSVPEFLSEKFTLTQSYGRGAARRCVLDVSAPSQRQAVDFDLNWENGVLGDLGFSRKQANIKTAAAVFPYASGSETTIKLPKNCLIKSASVFKPAQGGSGSTYQLFVGNGDKSSTYGSSTSAAQANAHSINANDINVYGSTDNTRTVRLWSTGGDSGHTGGWALVEYV